MTTTVTLSDGRKLNFNDQFKSLTPDDQQRAVAQAVQSLGPSPEVTSGGQPTPQEPTRETTQNPLQGFANNALQLASNTLENVESVGDVASGAITLARAKSAIRRGDNDRAKELISNNPFESQGLAGRTSDSLDAVEANRPAFQSRVGLKDIDSAGDLGSFILDNTIASAPAGLALAVPGVGAATVATAEQRKIAEERAKRDGREDESTADLAIGGAASFFNTTLGRIGIRGSKAADLSKALRPSQSQLKKIADSTLDAGRAVVRETITGAPQGAAEELASGLGTEQGTSLQAVGENALTEALVGAGAGGAIDVASGARDFTQNVNDRRSIGKEVLADENRLLAQKQAIDEIEIERQSVRDSGGAVLPDGRENTQLARQSAARVTSEVTGLLSELKKNGKISKTQAVNDLIADGNTFSKVDLDDVNSVSGKNSPLDIASKSNRRFGQKQLDQINELDLDTDVKESLTQSLLVIDELSRAGVGRNATSGPFETAFNRLGRAAATPLAIAALGAGPAGFGAGAVLTTTGLPGARSLGRLIDGVQGSRTPDIVRNADAINRELKRRNIETEGITEGLEASSTAVSADRSQIEGLVQQRRESNKKPNPAVSARILREQASKEGESIRAAKNKSRLTRLRNDPLGVKTPSDRNPQTGLPKTFDGIIQQRVFQTIARATGQSPETLGIVVGPGSFKVGEGPQGYIAALQLAFRRGDLGVTKQDISNFFKDPEALMEGQRGLDVIIPAIQQIYLEGLEAQGLTQQQQPRDIFNAPSPQ